MTSDEFRPAGGGPTPPLPSEAVVSLDPSADQELKQFALELRADPLRVLKARIRHAAVTDALKSRPDVVDVIPAASLARGTRVGNIHDADLIVVFDWEAHPEWHRPGSAGIALAHVQALLADAFHGVPFEPGHGAEKERVLKDRIGHFGGTDPQALFSGDPRIDVVPAIKVGPHLRVPARSHSELRYQPWADVDPEKLMRMVAARKREWSNVAEVTRLVKGWADHRQLGLNWLAVEIMVLEYLRRPGVSETVLCSDALADFFQRAAQHISHDKIVGPRGSHTEIVPGLDYGRLRAALAESAILAQRAIDAERAWTARGADAPSGPLPVTHPRDYWRRLLGEDSIDRPTVWYYSPISPETRPDPRLRRWFDERAEPADKTWSWTADPSPLTAGPI